MKSEHSVYNVSIFLLNPYVNKSMATSAFKVLSQFILILRCQHNSMISLFQHSHSMTQTALRWACQGEFLHMLVFFTGFFLKLYAILIFQNPSDSQTLGTTALTLKAPVTTAADDIHKYFFIIFQRNQDLMFQVNPLLGREFTRKIKSYSLRKIKVKN